MELSLSALMVLNGVFIHVFSPTLPIILKSMLLSSSTFHLSNFGRVLLATIRDKGLCPCPRCLVPKTHLDRLGLKLDIRNRLTQFRHYMADKVKAARRVIYQDARPITGTNVEALLKSFSGVPTEVRVTQILPVLGKLTSSSFIRTLLSKSLELISIPQICWLWI